MSSHTNSDVKPTSFPLPTRPPVPTVEEAETLNALHSYAGDETVCHRCGGPNLVWFAASPLWNAVMRGGSINGPWEYDEIICPTCFCVLAEERGVAMSFRLNAAEVAVELETVTPSGRVWDAERWLWVEPDAGAESVA